MTEIIPVRLGQDEHGQLWLLKQVGISWVPHRKITTLIEGNDLIIETEEEQEVLVS